MEKEYKCMSCKAMLPASSFSKNKAKWNGLNNYCRACDSKKQAEYRRNNREKKRNADKRYRWSPERAREYMLNHKYGFEPGEYERRLEDQGGGCYLCGATPEENKQALAVDHCHTHGHVRKLLCKKCNKGLGLFKDDPQLLRKAADYLEEHNGRREEGLDAYRPEGEAWTAQEIGASSSQRTH